MNNQIRCPYCNKSFEPTGAYKHELKDKEKEMPIENLKKSLAGARRKAQS